MKTKQVLPLSSDAIRERDLEFINELGNLSDCYFEAKRNEDPFRAKAVYQLSIDVRRERLLFHEEQRGLRQKAAMEAQEPKQRQRKRA
jgi:hypothetical protein